MKKYFQSNFVTVFVLFAMAVLISAAVYPEVFITFKTSFVLWDDYCIEYPLTFVLTTFFYQGGLQLWDFFGQMPYFHTYAVNGLFEFSNVMTAVAYYILAPFSGDSAKLFHHVFAWADLMTLLLMRVIGIFLFLKTVTKNRYILTIGTVIFAVFFSQMAFLRGVLWASYFPLGMYFIVRFFQDLQWRYLAAIVVFLAIRMGSGLLDGGYMYLPMHFFIISGILWRMFFKSGPRDFFIFRGWDFSQWRKTAGIILVVVLIMAPYVYINQFGFPDLAMGLDNSRLSHMFSPDFYFHHLELSLGSPVNFFSYILNMQLLNHSVFYMGWTFLFLALAGVALSRNTLKYFFALAVVFLWLLSFPREGANIGLIAHWINALTNPVKTLPRAYETSCHSMLAYLLMPLAVMGIEAMIEFLQGKKYSPGVRRFLLGTLCLLVLIDVFCIIYQSKRQIAHDARRPIVFDVSPQSGTEEYDFENPSIFPYRNSYTFHFSYKDEQYLWFPHSLSSDLHHVINQALNYTYLNGYNPRHVEFVEWLHDPAMLAYLRQNYEFIFLAPTAINASPDALSRISGAGLGRQVIEVDDPNRSLGLPDQWPASITSKDEDNFQYDQIPATLDDVNGVSEYHWQGDMMIYTLHLPSSFPEHEASSWFPPEQHYLRFIVERDGGKFQELQSAQGELIKPYTFDVQNIKKGQLKAAFPKDDFPLHRRCVLLYPSRGNQGVEGLWRRQFDNLGIIYRAKRDGWLVAHYPYDSKWQISVDDHPVTYYRVNETFIGFPLTRGEHRILIQYWPHSPLRILLLVSALLTTFGLPVLIFLALKWENKENSAHS